MSHVDPGLDQPAQAAADDVERDVYEADYKQAEEEEQDFLDPSLWWFASTACPLIAGTFGPIANAFSICALVVKWRVFMPPGVDEAHGNPIEDPKWLTAINSVSLVFALAANLALLLNMARRLPFAIAQPITIIGWYIASVLLIILVSLASTSSFRIEPRTEHALSQAYYYGIMAAAIYFIIASLLVTTVVGAYKGHYPKEFRLTPSQRTLMLQTIGFVVYLLLGALVFSKVEGWPYLDAIFWADFTLLTIGVGGEFVPKTHTGRSLLFPFAIGGIVMVGLVVGSVRSLVLERGKQKLSARLVETKRESVLSSLNDDSRTMRLGFFEKVDVSEKAMSESERREREFHIMRRVQQLADRKRRYSALAMSTTAALLLWFLGALLFKYSEKPQGWSYFISLYFAYTTLLTIGYGDYTPNSNAGKAFFVFWTLLAVPTLTILISNMGDTVIKAFKDLTIWIGSLTVFPDEGGLMTTLKVGIGRMKKGKLNWKDNSEKRSPGAAKQALLDRLTKHIEDEELGEAEEAGEHGDTLERDIHFYHFVLAKEVRQLMKDVEASPPKEYTYEEWTYYLRLLGQYEDDPAKHRKPGVENENGSKPDLGTAAGADDDQSWSWLGIRSPLMGNKNEAQWLLQRLSATLEKELRKMRSPNPKEREEPPPISMSDLRSRSTDSGDSGSDPKKTLKKNLNAAEIRRRKGNGD
ncbi:potassium channel-like protein [Lophiostoma macrostomum CBS 122681]|uniref:Potassium channel-like protein n=1 Tax=Lophiostoma macrostomum CBS 122681 TaxID=1314788 RepID=A0A6A6TJA3_9PLEO|nr:potassium channel-like protein [Lophiostoma macrostomum CBS 122681]